MLAINPYPEHNNYYEYYILTCQALIEAHDDVAAKNYEAVPDFLPVFAPPPQVFQVPPADAIRMVGIRKNPDEPLVSCVMIFNPLFVVIISLWRKVHIVRPASCEVK